MKKLLIISALLLVGTYGFAQVKVELGLKGGLNLAKLSSEERSVDLENKTGYHLGAYGLVKVLNFGVQPEILYSTRGAKFNIDDIQEDFSQEYTYLDIPIMLKLYTVAGINIQAGPQFGMLMNVNGKTADGDRLQRSDLKDADISGAIGLGWDAPFGLRFNARYLHGFSDVSEMSTAKTRAWQLSVAYRIIGLGK